MPFIWIVVAGVIVGYVCGGKLSNIQNVDLRGAPLVLIAIGIQLLIFLPVLDIWSQLTILQVVLHWLSYVLLLVVLLLNRRLKGMYFIALGMLLNFAVIFANGGYMPVPLENWVRAGFADVDLFSAGAPIGNAILMTDKTVLPYLGDILCIPMLPSPRLLSIGDVVLALGAILLLTQMMRQSRATD
jgi:uncharacterized protein (DUF983 family)